MNDDAAFKLELKTLLVKRLRLNDVDPASLADDAALVGGGLALDSIDMLEVALAVEDRFAVKIADEDLARKAFRSINDLADFIRAHRESPAEGPSASE